MISKTDKKTKTKVDDLIIEKTNGKISLILMLIGMKLALLPLQLTLILSQILQRIIFTFIIIVMTLIVIIVFDIILQEWGKYYETSGFIRVR